MKAFTYAASAAALVAAVISAVPASAQTARVRVGDLDMNDPAASRILDQRIDRAARDLCRRTQAANTRIGQQAACRTAVRGQVHEALARRNDVARDSAVRLGA